MRKLSATPPFTYVLATVRGLLCCFLAMCCLFTVGQAQTSQVQFGKNRVQHHRDFDEWVQYESDNFVTYWYGEGRNIGQAVVQIAEHDFGFVQSILEHRMNEKLQIIVYTDLTDLKQSNIGNEEAFTNIAGQTKIAANKIFVYFNGDHNDLRRQIREGIASVYLEAMLFGSNLQEIVQNAVLLNLPDWFKTGLISYIGNPWDTQLDNQLRQLLASGEYTGFEAMAAKHPKLVGHAFWYYVSELYGTPTVSNLLYLTRINRSVESGFLYVLGTPYQITLNDWQNYFEKRYAIDNQNRNLPQGQEIAIKNKRQSPVTQLKLSPNGQELAYVINEIGRSRVYLQNLQTGERSMIFKNGFRNALQATDYNYPLLSWNPSGQELAILYENRDVVRLMRYSLLEKTAITEPLGTEYHRVYSMEYVNPSTLVLSGTVRGFSDIFLYYPATRQSQRITTDFWDDLDATPVNVRGRTGILFASNRTDVNMEARRLDTILPITTFDLYYYDLSSRPGELVQVTNTPLANERRPIGIDTTYFAYLSDRHGIYNQEIGYLEEYIDHYEQIIILNDGSEIVLHADSSLVSLDTTLIDTIEIYPVLKERALTLENTNYDRNLMHQQLSRTGRLLSYFPGVQPMNGTILLQTLATEGVNQVNPTIYQHNRLTLYHQKLSTNSGAIEASPNQLEEIEVDPPSETIPEEAPSPPPAASFEPQTPPAPAAVDSIEVIDIDSYLFQSEFAEEETFAEPPSTEVPKPATDLEGIVNPISTNRTNRSVRDKTNKQSVYRFRPGNIIPYRTTFRTDFVTFNMDNSLLFEGLDSYAANPNGFNTQPLSLVMKANFKDLFEDFVIEGGLRLPTSFNGTEYFLTLQNRKHRLDRMYSVYRRNQRFAEARTDNWRRENNVVLGQYTLRYPLDIFQSIRATGTLRRDRVQYIATNRSALEEAPAPNNTQRIGLRLEYVFDNTLDLALNTKQGTRAKVYTEYMKTFRLNIDPTFEFDFAEGFLGLVGLDARHYLKIDKRSILAFRLAGAMSFGADKILYYLGGADNELFATFNNNIPGPTSDPGLVTLANSMRGFDLNIRNGNTYVLGNVEARIPIFRYISENIRSPFFRNFQLVGFFDAGTAWSGSDPYSDENPLNTSTFPENTSGFNPTEIRVVYFRDPLVFSYGIGARTLLFGYMVRLDYAWGLETRNVLDPKLHLSLGMDF